MALSSLLARRATGSLRLAAAGASRARAAAAEGGAVPPATCDLTDKYWPRPVDDVVGLPGGQRVVSPALGLVDLGGVPAFCGPAATVRCFENNPLVRAALGEPGGGRVLVVDGGGSMRCALLGDELAAMGARNGWAGVVVNGCVRDSKALKETPIGVRALGTHPLKSSKRDPGLRDVPVTLGSTVVEPGDYVYADEDGIIVSDEPLSFP